MNVKELLIRLQAMQAEANAIAAEMTSAIANQVNPNTIAVQAGIVRINMNHARHNIENAIQELSK